MKKSLHELRKDLISQIILGEDYTQTKAEIQKGESYKLTKKNFDKIELLCPKIADILNKPYKLVSKGHFKTENPENNPKYFNKEFIGLISHTASNSILFNENLNFLEMKGNKIILTMPELSTNRDPICLSCGASQWSKVIFSKGKVELVSQKNNQYKTCPVKSIEQTFTIKVLNSISFFNYLNDETIFDAEFINSGRFSLKYNIQYPNGRFNYAKKYAKKNIGYVQCGQGISVYKHKTKNQIILTTGHVAKTEKHQLKDFVKKGTIRGDVWRAMFADLTLSKHSIPEGQDTPIKVEMAKGTYSIQYNEDSSKSVIAKISKTK